MEKLKKEIQNAIDEFKEIICFKKSTNIQNTNNYQSSSAGSSLEGKTFKCIFKSEIAGLIVCIAIVVIAGLYYSHLPKVSDIEVYKQNNDVVGLCDLITKTMDGNSFYDNTEVREKAIDTLISMNNDIGNEFLDNCILNEKLDEKSKNKIISAFVKKDPNYIDKKINRYLVGTKDSSVYTCIDIFKEMLRYGSSIEEKEKIKMAIYSVAVNKLKFLRVADKEDELLANYLMSITSDEDIALKSILKSYVQGMKKQDVSGEESIKYSWALSSYQKYFKDIIDNGFTVKTEFYYWPRNILGYRNAWKYSANIHGIITKRVGTNTNGMKMLMCEPQYIYRFDLSNVIPIEKIEVLDNRIIFDNTTDILYEIDLKVTSNKDTIIKYLRTKYNQGEIIENNDSRYCELWKRLNVVIYYDYDIKNNISTICVIDRQKWEAKPVKLYGTKW